MSATLTVTPGPKSMAGMVLVGEDKPALVIALDPVNVAIHVPEVENGTEILSRFCKELALEAGRVAAFLEADMPAQPDWHA